MRLSEAILMGRHTVESPKPWDITKCAIPMALNAVSDRTVLKHTSDGTARLRLHWPWLLESHKCPRCRYFGEEQIVWHVFDNHVTTGQMTLEQMCDWIRSIEPAEPEPDPRDEEGSDVRPELEVYKGR